MQLNATIQLAITDNMRRIKKKLIIWVFTSVMRYDVTYATFSNLTRLRRKFMAAFVVNLVLSVCLMRRKIDVEHVKRKNDDILTYITLTKVVWTRFKIYLWIMLLFHHSIPNIRSSFMSFFGMRLHLGISVYYMAV